jgi:hypothetical protein
MLTEMAAAQFCACVLHDVLGRVAAKSSGRDHHGFLHGHGLVVVQAALPSLQCLRPWSI